MAVGIAAVVVSEIGEKNAEADLEEDFFQGSEALAAHLLAGGKEKGAAVGGELEPVIDCPDRAEPDEADEGHADVEIVQVGQRGGR